MDADDVFEHALDAQDACYLLQREWTQLIDQTGLRLTITRSLMHEARYRLQRLRETRAQLEISGRSPRGERAS